MASYICPMHAEVRERDAATCPNLGAMIAAMAALMAAAMMLMR